MTYLIIDNEAARLNALRDLHLLDTPPSDSFDRITRMASKLFDAPVSTISLTDSDRQWFKSKVGVDLESIPREQAPCSYAIKADSVFIIEDMLEDERFKTSPLAQAGIRFYAGAPLITRSGFGLGTLCIVDSKPRTIGIEQERVLRDLAALVMAQVEIQNMIGRVDASSGQPNEHQLFEDLSDLASKCAGEPMTGVLVEFEAPEQTSHGLRVLGASYFEHIIQASIERLRHAAGNVVRLYQVGPSRCLALWHDATGHDAEEFMERCGRTLRETILCNGIPVVIDPAMGLYRFKAGEHSGKHVLRCLFNAVDDARQKKLSHAAYSKHQDDAHARSFSILHDVPNALAESGELSLVYQPRIEMKTGRCIGAEALLRWKHPKLGQLSPAEFIPLIEKTALVQGLTDWVFEAALRQVAAWRAAGVKPRVSINASANNLAEPDFAARLQARLLRHEVPHDAIELEFTESALAEDGARIRRQLEKVQGMGIEVAIDDFGTGYSSLSYLQHLPATILKIDRSFMQRLMEEARDRKLVQTMIGMAHDLGFRVVAEGIETGEVYRLLKNWNCDEAQGYWMARPMPAEDFVRWYREHATMPTDAARVA